VPQKENRQIDDFKPAIGTVIFYDILEEGDGSVEKS
jgi:predicted oxidoreductase (fatty acid repression mutant protein)